MQRQFKHVEEAVDYLMSLRDSDVSDISDDEIEICQLPPDENERISEEEDIDDNILCPVAPADVCGNVCLFSKRLTIDKISDERVPSPTSSNIVCDQTPPKTKGKRKRNVSKEKGNQIVKKQALTKWKESSKFDNVIQSKPLENICDKFPEIIETEPLDIFFKFLSQEYLAYLAEMTTNYALQHGVKLQTDWKDIAQFFGLLLLSGYHHVPSENDYWSTAADTSVPLVSSVMTRKQFRDLKRNFHLMDNSFLKPADKLGKIQPIYDELNQKFLQFGIFNDKLSIDESMVPYYGNHSSKMFIRGKPIRFGFKIWMICGSNGYPYKMQIYAGKQLGETGSLGTRVVNNLLSIVNDPLQVEVFFDNFFTSYDLMKSLAERSIKATGTIREIRAKFCPLIPCKELQKQKRGTFDYKSDGSVYVCRWNDRAAVTVASNYSCHEPIQSAKRYSHEKKKKVDVQQPRLIHEYNSGMGGVDLLDKMLSSYRPQLRNKKWWWNLFANALNMTVVAGWLLHKATRPQNGQYTHLKFRREITISLLRIKPRIDSIRPGPKAHSSATLRKTDGHYLIGTAQGRCAQCNKNARLECNECKKRMHLQCFPAYHGISA